MSTIQISQALSAWSARLLNPHGIKPWDILRRALRALLMIKYNKID